jgi:hypothetical protein
MLLLLIKFYAIGQSKSYFPALKRVLIDKDYNAYFNFDKTNTRFLNRPCYSLPKNHPVYCDSSEAGETWYLVAKFKSHFFKDSLDIVYSAGPSADPGFSISDITGKILTSINCIDFYINELGTIYTSGHTNNMFNQRRKFEIKKDTIIEVKQPYYYVGLKSKTLTPITLYKEKTGKEIIAQLLKNYAIEVLLAENTSDNFYSHKYFLVKTEFGLIGWLRLTDYEGYDPLIEGLFYAGD